MEIKNVLKCALNVLELVSACNQAHRASFPWRSCRLSADANCAREPPRPTIPWPNGWEPPTSGQPNQIAEPLLAKLASSIFYTEQEARW